MVTIKDVADKSGVSIATVSNYINGKTVKPYNRIAIESAIQDLGYEVNMLARSFRTKQTYTVGVVVNTFYSLFYMELLHEMERHLKENGYCMIVFCSDNDCENERRMVKLLMEKFVDAIVLFPASYEHTHIADIVQNRVPVVVADHTIKDLPYAAVVADNINASYTATEYLIKKGHKSIALVGGHLDASTAKERVTGYLRAMEDYGLHQENNMFFGEYSKESGYRSTLNILRLLPRFTALYVLSFDLLLGVLEALQEKHIRYPTDISLVTFDYSEYLDMSDRKITAVKQPNKQLGIEIAKMALNQIQNPAAASSEIVRCKCEFLIRESVAALPR